MAAPSPTAVEEIETRLLVEGLRARWGVDLGDRAKLSLRREARRIAREAGLPSVAALLAHALHDEAWRDRLLDGLTGHDVTLFRQPDAWVVFRHKLVPLLRTWPRLRFWVPACGTGEDAWALAVVPAEEGLYDRSHVWATDVGPGTLARASAGVWPLDRADAFSEAHARGGGRLPLASWIEPVDGRLVVRDELRRRVYFASHGLDARAPHNSFHAIVCRDALLYLDADGADLALDLLAESLVPFGALLLGRGETLEGSRAEARLERLDPREKIYRRLR
jgi:chemotaxis protein methyltransferase CheR